MDDAKILGYSHSDNFHTASIFVNYAQTIHMKDIFCGTMLQGYTSYNENVGCRELFTTAQLMND